MMSYTRVILVTLVIALFIGCNSEKKKQKNHSPQEVQEALLAYNKRLVESIKAEIETFVETSKDSFIRAEEGFYYKVIKKGNNVYPKTDNHVTCKLIYKLLDGTICYPEKQDNVTDFVVGKNTLSILNHSIKKVDVGGEIQVVVSPYMGFGLNGDGKNIPPARAFLINISLLKVNNETMK